MVRYADTPVVEISIDISAPPNDVWELVTDINIPARFSTEFRGADWLDGAGPALGSQFIGRNGHGVAGQWETTCTIIWFEPLRSFGYAVNDLDAPAARWRFDLEPAVDGTKLTMWAQMGPGRSGVSWFIYKHPDREEEIMAGRLEEWRTNMEATLNGIKSMAESAP